MASLDPGCSRSASGSLPLPTPPARRTGPWRTLSWGLRSAAWPGARSARVLPPMGGELGPPPGGGGHGPNSVVSNHWCRLISKSCCSARIIRCFHCSASRLWDSMCSRESAIVCLQSAIVLANPVIQGQDPTRSHSRPFCCSAITRSRSSRMSRPLSQRPKTKAAIPPTERTSACGR